MSRRWKDWCILAIVASVSTGALWVMVGMQTIYANFDGPYYAVIAKCLYDSQCARELFSFSVPLEYYPAHFPLYPILIRLTGLIAHIGLLQAGAVVGLVATACAAVVLYKLVEDNKWGNPLWVSLAWLFFWPRMWAVRSVGSPETLLSLGIFTSVYFFVKKNFWLAAMAGMFAVLSKPPGILLFIAYGLVLAVNSIKTKKVEWKAWPLVLMPLALMGLFGFYQMQTGDFWAYFHSGDNIHLQYLPFRIFDSNQAWVGTFWLEDVLWIYLIGGIGIVRAIKKAPVLGWFGAIFYVTILFVSHRDIARYSLPIVPVVLVGLSDVLERREVRWAMGLLLIPMFFYSVNFLLHNTAGIANWQPFL